jgi:hypothetical protein
MPQVKVTLSDDEYAMLADHARRWNKLHPEDRLSVKTMVGSFVNEALTGEWDNNFAIFEDDEDRDDDEGE